MKQKKFTPVYNCIEAVEPDESQWTAWHMHYGYNQNMFAYFSLKNCLYTKNFENLNPKVRGQWKHVFDVYDDVEMNCKFLDVVFMDWPLFKMKHSVGNNYPTPEIMLTFKEEIKEVVESGKGFCLPSRPVSQFNRNYFTETQNYYIINDDHDLFSQYRYDKDDYK